MTSTRPHRVSTRPALGVAMVVAAATAWGLNGTVSKLLMRGGFDPPQLTTFRAVGAFLVLLLLVLVTRGPRPLAAAPREIPRLVVYGLLGVFGVPLLYFVAISRLPVGIGLLFEFTAPVFVALWVRFGERRRVRRRLWLGLGLSVVGLSSVAQLWSLFDGGLRLDGLGILAGVCSALMLAAWYVLGSRYVAGPPPTPAEPAPPTGPTPTGPTPPTESTPTGPTPPAESAPTIGRAATIRQPAAPVTVRDPLTLTCWAFGVTALVGAASRAWWVLGAEASTPRVYFDWRLLAGQSGGQPMWLLAGYFIVIGTVVPYLLLTHAMRHLPPTSVGIVGMTEIVLASAFAWLLLAETLSPAQIIGGLVLVVGVALAESARTPTPPDNAPPSNATPSNGPPMTGDRAANPGGFDRDPRSDQAKASARR